jgi:hypothetical protein
LLEFEFSLELVGLVMNTDNRRLEIEVPDLVVGERFSGLGIDFDESVSRTIRGLVHESIVRLVKEHLVVDDIGLLLIRSITVVITRIEWRDNLAAVLAESSAIVLDGSGNSIDVGNTVVMLLLVVVEKKDVRPSLDEMRLVDLIEKGMVKLVNQNVDVEC